MDVNTKTNHGNIIRKVLTIICIVCLLVSLFVIVSDKIASSQRKKKIDNLQNLYSFANGAEEDAGLLDWLFPAACAEEDSVNVQEDFQELYAINADLIGWLEMGEEISLPVVFRDNEYYLNHDFYGDRDANGTLFVNEANTLWPKDRNILIHGHHTPDNTYLGAMDKFRKLDWLKQNPVFYFRMIDEEEKTAYIPIGFFDASVTLNTRGFFDIHVKFESDDMFMGYADAAKERSLFDIPVDVDANDQLLTVVTCSYVYDNSRFIMVARALREDETIESATAAVLAAEKK